MSGSQRMSEKLLQDVHDEFYNEDGRLVDGPEYFLGTIVGSAKKMGSIN